MAWTPFSQTQVDELFAALRARDPFGHRVHTFFAIAACFFAGWPTTWLEFAWIGLLVCCAIRLLTHHRILGPLVWEWPLRLMLLWVAWSGLSLLWTAGTRDNWLEEWGTARYVLLIPALWPVMSERRWLIAAAAAGALCGNLSQVAHAIGRAAEIDWLTWSRFADRNSGWWDPVVGGSILCAALGLHLAGLALGRSMRERAFGGVMSIATLVAIAATGTRGAWLGAAGLLGVAALLAVWRAVQAGAPNSESKPRGRRIGLPAVLVAISAAAIWFVAGTTITKRVHETRAELTRAMEGDYSTFTGERLAMWGWSWQAIQARPLHGVGVGGFRTWVDAARAEAARSAGAPAPKPMLHGHAHSWPIHAAATTGIVGLAIMAALVVVCFRGGLHGPIRGFARGYDAGPALALVGLAGAGMFDTIHVNQQTAYWLWMLVALCMKLRPRETGSAARPGGHA